MALDRTKMQRVSGSQLQSHWLYNTPDTIATVTGAGYFNAITNEVNQWDTCSVVSETGGTSKVDMIHFTSARGAASVTTSAVEGITAT